MKNEDLLNLLQDIVEDDAVLIRLNEFYVVERNIKLDVIQRIIVCGLKSGILEIFKQLNPDEENAKPEEYYKKISLEEAVSIVNNQESWSVFPNGYEVSFVDNSKYLWILINNPDNKVPDEFIQFLKE